jgi:hypothetical protein
MGSVSFDYTEDLEEMRDDILENQCRFLERRAVIIEVLDSKIEPSKWSATGYSGKVKEINIEHIHKIYPYFNDFVRDAEVKSLNESEKKALEARCNAGFENPLYLKTEKEGLPSTNSVRVYSFYNSDYNSDLDLIDDIDEPVQSISKPGSR